MQALCRRSAFSSSPRGGVSQSHCLAACSRRDSPALSRCVARSRPRRPALHRRGCRSRDETLWTRCGLSRVRLSVRQFAVCNALFLRLSFRGCFFRLQPCRFPSLADIIPQNRRKLEVRWHTKRQLVEQGKLDWDGTTLVHASRKNLIQYYPLGHI